MAHTRTLLLMVGESGSGKSTLAQQMVEEKGYVRLNRDTLRIELAPALTDPAFRAELASQAAIVDAGVRVPKQFKGGAEGRDFEDLVAKVQRARAAFVLAQDVSVIIDDTNLNPNTVDKWRHFAGHKAAFDIFRVMTPMDECIRRDAQREGRAHVGRAVIERQFLMSGRHPLIAAMLADPEAMLTLYDIDGTVATFTDHSTGKRLRSPFGLNVEVDLPYPGIIEHILDRKTSGDFTVGVSGRKSSCGDATIAWLDSNGVPHDGLFMRHSYDNRSDVLVKADILRELLAHIPKERIRYVVDDRPQVVRGWIENGIPVRPVYAGNFITLEEFHAPHAEGCAFAPPVEGYRRCPDCGALENF